ncbi:carbamoyl-phosphate synthase large subunit [Rhodococcus sp. ACPA4]|uniref:acetyl-CoA carboxylase family protein n=1 Tax=Rhodococcus sp. ACPA4 TaxID=2028571 RepID=UPI000BB11D40|nr:carboxyl transferase domain-containing protein [Rhodococcus sp. ACPA4]PBC36013.1 carbamoyl-phosphate synthase large subunit [Rhodococcus sp. ACPA4]
MPVTQVLIANRGEIAVRIARACDSLDLSWVTVYARDDHSSAHVTERSYALDAEGPAAYLDIAALIAAAKETGCDAVHPGYGFLSENADFAQACLDAGLIFVGPAVPTLRIFGDKMLARRAAVEAGLPVLRATDTDTGPAAAEEFFDSVPGAVMVKAVAGGGGRGIRVATHREEVAPAVERCRSEALRAFGNDAVYVEELLARPRHIEVQLIGDGHDVVDLGERDCSIQRNRQKIIELAPAPALSDSLRRDLLTAARTLGQHTALSGVATVEFLVDPEHDRFVFLEVNPRIQVEHTITEQVTGVDLVAGQLRIAAGTPLSELDLPDPPPLARSSVQLRLNAESMTPDGRVRAEVGTIDRLDLPTGSGIRVDTHAQLGLQVSPRYDSLLAKIIVDMPIGDPRALLDAAIRALDEVRIDGVETNAALVRSLLARPEIVDGSLYTTLVDDQLHELIATVTRPADDPRIETGDCVVHAAMTGVVIAVDCAVGADISRGAPLLVLESMKMEHVVAAPVSGRVERLMISVGDVVTEGDILAVLGGTAGDDAADIAGDLSVELNEIRPDLMELETRLGYTRDDNRPDATAKRRALGRRTARENLTDLCDEGSFVEYGALTVAAQRGRRPLQDLIENTPADGLICGIATIDGTRCVVMSYDYTVFAGTQGMYGHRKQARMFTIAAEQSLPIVLYTEGGGGRPGDVDTGWIAGLDDPTFTLLARLSGSVPIVAIVSGRCFAGNAALAGCADIIIATPEASLGMGGPAMIEGGGLGTFHPDVVGPMSVQVPNGVVDILADDEAHATALARQVLGNLSGIEMTWTVDDQRLLRHLVPTNRARAYDVRPVITTVADTGSALELRPDFGSGVLTYLARLEGRPIGIVANNSMHLGGAIDADAADKMARFLQLCDAHGLPILSLCDTPGFMVGPEAEKSASVRHFPRVFVVGANLRVPVCFVALRKAYGLGAMAMSGGHLHAATAAFAWPTGEFGGMGLEGSVRLGYRRELEDIADPVERQDRFAELVDEAYERGKALNIATVFEIDGVIDPAETRTLVCGVIGKTKLAPRRNFVDTW